MKVKTIAVISAIAVVGVGAFFLGRSTGHKQAASATSSESKTLYTCGMHPQVIQDHPGNCPICGMKLTPIREQPGTEPSVSALSERKIKYYKSTMIPGEVRQTSGKDSMGMEMVPVYEDEAAGNAPQTIAIDPVTVQNMDIRTATVTRGPLRRTIRTVGSIDYNETALADVTTKFKGWVEKLYVDATGQQVHRGDPLFEIYSPELYSAQTEYVLALGSATNGAPGSTALLESARTKLKFFDISDAQIAELKQTRQPQKTLRILAPADGFVVEKMVVEGQMVDAGMKLYRIADIGLVWVQAQIYEQDLVYIKLGQEATVTLSYLPDRAFRGRVTYIYPNVDEKTRTAQVRMEFHNPGYFLKPGMFATVQIVSELEPSALLVPDMAILRSGEKNTVFVALPGGKFEPRSVALGPQAENDYYQVLHGLSEGERVVISGQFLLDSESQLREAIQKMLEPKKPAAPSETETTNVMAGMAMGNEAMPAAEGSVVKYVCPMPEHVSIEYDHPGKCPICGMTLVPVTQNELRTLQPGGKVLYYTCPMPEHSDVRSDKPGKCPRCGMTLIPVLSPPPLEGASMNQAPAAKAEALPTLYTCPMATHADVVSDQPGKCPKCEMDLVPTSTVAHGKVAEENWRKQHAHEQYH
jgi:RND family efflux transporter MFP subunit